MVKNPLFQIILSLLLVGLLISTGCTQAPGSAPAVTTPLNATTPDGQEAKVQQMISFVREARAYVDVNGKEKALAEFSNPKGSFVRGEYYIYAYDYTGTTLAHPVNPEKIGINQLNEKDAGGKYVIRELMNASRVSPHFVEYTDINPVQSNRVERKLGYVERVDDNWWLGTGIYLGPVDTPGTPAPDVKESGTAVAK